MHDDDETTTTYLVLRSFNVFAVDDDVELDPEDDGTKALLREGYIEAL